MVTMNEEMYGTRSGSRAHLESIRGIGPSELRSKVARRLDYGVGHDALDELHESNLTRPFHLQLFCVILT